MASPKPPNHLSRAAKTWWRQVHSDYDLDDHHRHLLRLACESMDEAEKARAALAEHGHVVLDRFGCQKSSPWCDIEHKAQNRFGFFAANSAWTLSRATARECRGMQRMGLAADAAAPQEE